MTIEKVNPIVDENGVEFYVSADGQETGMSIRGLARFIGMPEATLRKGLLAKLEESGDANEGIGVSDLPESLKPFAGKAFELRGINKAKVIRSELCAAIVFHVAFESSTASPETKQSATLAYQKFAQYGLHKFIHKISGFIEKQDEVGLLTELRKAIGDIKALNEFATEYKTIRGKTTTFMPGCNDLLNELKNEEPQEDFELLEASEDGSMTLKAWLHNKGVTLSDTKYRSLSHMVAATFKSMVKRDPTRKTAKGKDKTRYNICVYEPQHFPLLQICLNKVLES